MHELIQYSCFNCHTKFLSFKGIIDKCPICNTTSFKITKKNFDLDIITGKINYSRLDFLTEIKKVIKNHPFLPDEFLKLKKLKEKDLNIFYIPAFLYSSKLKAELNLSYSGNFVKKKSKIKFANYINYYSQINEFDLKQIKPFNIMEINKYELDLENIIIEELDDKINIDNIRNKLIKLYEENEIQKLNKKYRDLKITDSDYKFFDEDYQVIYLPIYLYIFNYKDKVYKFLMNVNTGKFTYEILNSKLKISLFILSIFIFTIFLTFCMYMLFEENAFKRWFCYLIIIDIVMLIWLSKKCKKEVITLNNSNLIYEIIEETEGD